MKHLALFFLIALLTIIFPSCKKEETFMSNATITGFDLKMCACCGGTKIIIDNLPNINNDTYYLIGQLPVGFSLGNFQFPIAVKINYKITPTHCNGLYIDITKIERS